MFNPIFIIVALLFLSVLVVVHEFGHFIVAKRAGVWVEEFGIGLPPKIWGKKIGKTLYSINAIPLGGFVKLHGETGDGEIQYPKKAFVNKSAKARIAISLAGIGMNIVFAVICLTVIYSFQGIPKERNLGHVLITDVASSTPALDSGFASGDIPRKVNNKVIKTNEDFIKAITDNGENIARVEVERKDETKVLYVKPKDHKIGVTITSKEQYFYYPPFVLRPVYGAYFAVKDTWYLSGQLVSGLFGIGKQLVGGEVPKGVGGPVVILAVTAEAAKFGGYALLNLAAIISLNLAFFNLLPFPPLDGSRVLFVVIEKLRGKKIAASLEGKIYMIGMLILLALAGVLTIREIPQLIHAGSLANFVDSVLK